MRAIMAGRLELQRPARTIWTGWAVKASLRIAAIVIGALGFAATMFVVSILWSWSD